MRNKILMVVILGILAISGLAKADDESFVAAGISMSGATNAGMVSKMNGGIVLDGEYHSEKFGFFGTLTGTQLEKNGLGKTQQLSAYAGATLEIWNNFDLGAGYRYTTLRFTDIDGERIDTAPFLLARYNFPKDMRLIGELHLPDSSKYNTRAFGLALEQTFKEKYRFRVKLDVAQFDYNAPVSNTSASTEELIANTSSATAPPGFERETLTSLGYAIVFSYRF